MRAAPYTLRFTVRRSELGPHEQVLTRPEGTLAAEAHSISGLLAARPRRRADDPAREPRAHAANPVLLGLA
ncbi:hypothetical protein GCM10010245_22280 [Streptomyces spectabilis]|nr:hypothetical protein GCM10010245_22280 [Streptomyces spectabilis]